MALEEIRLCCRTLETLKGLLPLAQNPRHGLNLGWPVASSSRLGWRFSTPALSVSKPYRRLVHINLDARPPSPTQHDASVCESTHAHLPRLRGSSVSHPLHPPVWSYVHAMRSVVVPTLQRVGLKANCWYARASYDEPFLQTLVVAP
jgi:hypothetical protein